jgi:RluA family pseudouridine synthase
MNNMKVDQDNEGVRIDRILRKQMVTVTLSEIYRFIRKGTVKVNGKKVKQNYRVKSGDIISVNIPYVALASENKKVPDKVASLVHTEFFRQNFTILYEDEDLLACNKPSGLVVHSGTGHQRHDTLIDLATSYLKNSSGKNSYNEPVLVHRLDRDTSGVILIAKNRKILRFLHSSIRNREVEKKYIALCHGVPKKKKGEIDLSLTRTHERNSGMKVKVQKGGKSSLSSYSVINSKKNISLVEIKLHTGRTHQIRVHTAHLSCPVIGDIRYGDHDRDTQFFKNHQVKPRLFLHAESIAFHHPTLNRVITLSAPVPEVFEKVLF